MLLLQKPGRVKETGVYGLFKRRAHHGIGKSGRRNLMLAVLTFALIGVIAALLAFRHLRDRRRLALHLYLGLLYARRATAVSASGRLFRRRPLGYATLG